MESLDDALKLLLMTYQNEEDSNEKDSDKKEQAKKNKEEIKRKKQEKIEEKEQRKKQKDQAILERIKSADVKITGANAGRVNASNLEERLTKIEKTLKTLVQTADIDRQQKKDDESVIRIIKPKHSIIARSHTSPNSFDEAVKLFMDMLFDQIDEQSKDEFVKLLKTNDEKVDKAIDQIEKSKKVFEDIKGIKQGENKIFNDDF